jgi:hypothetical protein
VGCAAAYLSLFSSDSTDGSVPESEVEPRFSALRRVTTRDGVRPARTPHHRKHTSMVSTAYVKLVSVLYSSGSEPVMPILLKRLKLLRQARNSAQGVHKRYDQEHAETLRTASHRGSRGAEAGCQPGCCLGWKPPCTASAQAYSGLRALHNNGCMGNFETPTGERSEPRANKGKTRAGYTRTLERPRQV